MAQPATYNRQFSFQSFQAAQPTTPLPGDEVDGELNAVKLTLDETLVNLAKLQRDDGALKNGIVTQESLADSLSIGFTFRGAWATATNYLVSDGASVGSIFYKAKLSHLSDGTNQPPNATYWDAVADFAPLAIEANSVGTTALQDLAVTTAKIAALAVTTAKIAADAVTTAKIIDGALSADATGRAKMADGFITLAKLADGILTADAGGRAKMADGFIATAKVADGFLSADSTGRAKMADGFISADAAGRAKIADGFLSADTAGRAKMADGFTTVAKLDTNGQQGLAKAWAHFNGTGTLAVTDSFNISSVTDVAVGSYEPNFAVVQPSTNYGADGVASGTNPSMFSHGTSFVHTTASYRFQTAYASDTLGNSTLADYGRIMTTVHGDAV